MSTGRLFRGGMNVHTIRQVNLGAAMGGAVQRARRYRALPAHQLAGLAGYDLTALELDLEIRAAVPCPLLRGGPGLRGACGLFVDGVADTLRVQLCPDYPVHVPASPDRLP